MKRLALKRIFSRDQPDQSDKRGLHALLAYGLTISVELKAPRDDMFARRPGQPYGTNRLLWRSPARPRDAADSDTIMRPAGPLSATHHGPNHFATDGTNLTEQIDRDL